jgi:DNA polymerase-3 subunit epsilon
MGIFVALDFETADRGRDSACALAIVRVEESRITAREHRLIRPPRREFEFTYVHGISWRDVRDQPPFAMVWRSMEPLLDGAEFIAAHNASFDSGVLGACCSCAHIAPPVVRFECTVQLARKRWKLHPTRLPDVCRHLGVSLNHHNALSDAEACAQIVIAARTTHVGTPRYVSPLRLLAAAQAAAPQPTEASPTRLAYTADNANGVLGDQGIVLYPGVCRSSSPWAGAQSAGVAC